MACERPFHSSTARISSNALGTALWFALRHCRHGLHTAPRCDILVSLEFRARNLAGEVGCSVLAHSARATLLGCMYTGAAWWRSEVGDARGGSCL